MKPEPKWDSDSIPRCDERCPAFDGKRCELLGFRPDVICEPAVFELVGNARDAIGFLDQEAGVCRTVGANGTAAAIVHIRGLLADVLPDPKSEGQ